MALTTTTQLTTAISGAYDKRLLDRLVPKFIFTGYGEERPVPANGGATLTLRRYTNLTAATTALTEGVTPAGSQLAKTDLTITCYLYGDYVTLTDWLDMTGLDPKIIRPLDILADQAGDTLDQLARNGMVAGTNIAYSGNSAALAAVDEAITIDMIKWAQNLLRRTSVEFISEKITAGQGIGTVPVDPGYVFICHTDMEADIATACGTSFIPVRSYAQPGRALPGEFGSYGFVRFISTPNAKIAADSGTTHGTAIRSTTGTNADAYYSVMFGKGYFANSRIGGNSTKTIIKNFGSGGTTDPLDQRSTVGWKATYGCSILDDRRGVTFICGATESGGAAIVAATATAGVGSAALSNVAYDA
jgi:N4-gp56 family major capsid protein